MKRDNIKNTLGEYVDLDKEQLEELTGKLLDTFHKELDNEKALTEAETKKLEAKEQELEEANKAIKNLKKNMKDPEEVAKQIQDYESTIAGLKEDLHNKDISSYETNKLTLAGAQDIAICQLALDYDKSKIKTEEDFKLIDEAIEKQKKEKAFLFKSDSQEVPETEKHANHYNPRVGSGHLDIKDTTGKDFAEKLSQENQGFLISRSKK